MTWMPHMKLWIPPPMRRSFSMAEATTAMPSCDAIAIELEDPGPIKEYVIALQRQCLEENIQVEGVVLNARAYFSFREHIHAQAWWSAAGSTDGCLVFLDMRIYMDPMRDDGEPVPLFSQDEAIKLYAMRKRPPSPDRGPARHDP